MNNQNKHSMHEVIKAVGRRDAQIHVLNPSDPLLQSAAHPPLVAPQHHNFFELAICWEGKMSIVGHSTTVFLKAGDAVVVKPGAWHYESYEKKSQSYRMCWLIATPQLSYCIFASYGHRLFTAVHYGGLPPLQEKADLENIVSEVEEKRSHWLIRARALLVLLLVDFNRCLKGSQPKAVAQHIDPIKDLLHIAQTQFREPLLIKELATKVGLSADYLSRRFHSVCGMTFKDYLNSIRIHHAKRLLESGWSIKQTADECGFNDVYYFSRVFKERCGTTPSSIYRKAKI